MLRFSDSRVGVSIADVVGKGLPAALLMSNLQAAVRAFATAQVEPHDVCASVNRLLCRNIASGKFVTFCYAVVDTARHVISYANAGHFPPVLVHAQRRGRTARDDGPRAGRLAATGRTACGQIATGSGDRLVCFTDGITEALSPDGDEFGDDRLVDLIRANRTASADALATTLADTQAAWTGGSAQDDATLIVVAID